MGAFENQIRENETFDSLMELYKESLEANKQLQSTLKVALNAFNKLRSKSTAVLEWQDEVKALLEDVRERGATSALLAQVDELLRENRR